MTPVAPNDPEADAARLAAEVQEAQARNRRGSVASSPNRLLLGMLLFGASAALVAVMFWPAPDPNRAALPTAEPDQFQTAKGSPFGRLAQPVVKTVPAPGPDPALMAQIAALQAELASLRNVPPPEAPAAAPDATRDDRLQALLDQLGGLEKSFADAQAANESALADRDLALQQLQAQLDAERLRNGAAMGPDTSAAERRLAAEEIYNRRAASPMIAFGGSNPGASPEAEAAMGAEGAPEDGRQRSANERFAREKVRTAPVERARAIASPAHTVLQGTMIQAVLETAINSDLPGAVRAIVAEDVHGSDGSRVLIPRGSRVIGAYSDQVVLGQRRAMVVWHRIILPDSQTVDIGATGGDAIGRAGLGGRVDSHFAARFGSAALISLIGLAPALALSDEDDEDDDGASDVADAMAANLSGAMGSTVSRYLDRPPTITVRQGAEVTIMVDRDLEIL